MRFVLERQMTSRISAVSPAAVKNVRRKVQLILLRHARKKLSCARDCRELAATLGNKNAASILNELAVVLESRAQALAVQAEKML